MQRTGPGAAAVMTRLSRRGVRLVVPAVVLAIMAASTPARGAGPAADRVSDVDVKAAFLYNFAKFAEWPAVAPGSSLVLCVLGDDRVAAALSSITHGQTIGGHAIEVHRLEPPGGAPCHLVFISDAAVREALPLLDVIKGQPVLTISDAARFASSGGMIEFFVEKGHMRFAINVDLVQRSQLHLSSRLLGIATIVRDREDHAR